MAKDKDELLKRCLESMDWMITDLKYHYDVDKQGEGGYSPKLKKAIELQNELDEYFME